MATNKNIKINLDYSDFTGGIKECNQQMALLTQACKTQQAQLGNNASEVDRLNISQQTLTQQLQLQTRIVEQAASKLMALTESESSTADEIDRAHIAFLKQEERLNNLKNQLDDVNESLERASQEEEQAGSSADSSSGGIEKLTSSFAANIAVVTSLVAGLEQLRESLMDVATQATQWADDLVTTSEQIGVSTDTLQRWSYASDMVDVSVETLQGAFDRLKKNMGDVAAGSETAISKFEELNVSVTNADGSLRSAEEVFYDVVDALGEIENSAQRDSAAMGIFGRSATQLNTLINAGSDTLKAYGMEAEQLGLVMETSTVQALAEMQNSFDRLDAVMQGAQNRLSAAFAPAVVKVIEVITQLDPAVLEVVAGIGMLLSVATALAPILQSIATITTLSTAAKLANAVATTVETEAEVGLAAAATTANASLMPQIAIAALLLAALAGLVYLIKELIDALTLEADAADAAAESTSKFTSAASGASFDSEGETGPEHHALGGYTRSRSVWVGEQGAELVDLPVGSYVHNSTDSRNYSKSTNVFNVTIDAKNVSDFNKVVRVFDGLSQSMNRGGYVNG